MEEKIETERPEKKLKLKKKEANGSKPLNSPALDGSELPPRLFALWKAAIRDKEKPSLGVVRIEPVKAMATDGHILLVLHPSERLKVKDPFTIEMEMCAQVLRAKRLSGEDARILFDHEDHETQISVGKYKFAPNTQLELFNYESVLEKKGKTQAKIAFSISAMQKLCRALRGLGVEFFSMDIGGETEPVEIGARVDTDMISGAIMPARMAELKEESKL